jgi:hypothetical protein
MTKVLNSWSCFLRVTRYTRAAVASIATIGQGPGS